MVVTAPARAANGYLCRDMAKTSESPQDPVLPTPRRLALRIVTMPRDTNPYGTIFGGVILGYIDQAGFVEARHHAAHRWVTAAIDRVDFKAPVLLGDVVSFHASTLRMGTKSVTIGIEVEAERISDGSVVPVTSATLTMVSVDASGKAVPFRSPPTV